MCGKLKAVTKVRLFVVRKSFTDLSYINPNLCIITTTALKLLRQGRILSARYLQYVIGDLHRRLPPLSKGGDQALLGGGILPLLPVLLANCVCGGRLCVYHSKLTGEQYGVISVNPSQSSTDTLLICVISISDGTSNLNVVSSVPYAPAATVVPFVSTLTAFPP